MKVPAPRKLKSGTWFIQLRLGGESIAVKGNTEKECRRQAELIKAEYRSGKRIAAAAPITLSQAIDAYIVRRENTLSPSTIRGYRTIQRSYLPSVTNSPLSDVKDWQKVVNDLASHYSSKTVKNTWRFLCSILRENSITPPVIALPQIVQKEHLFLEPEQVSVFVDAVKDSPCAIPALLALHSLRRSEIMALTWSNVDLKKNTIRVSGAAVFNEEQKLVQKETNKNSTSARTLPIMIPELRQALEAAKQKNGPVVTCNPNTIWAQINRVCASCNLPEVGTHGLRHSFASLAYHLGLSEMETMELGGWADIQTMRKIYTHLAKADRLKAQNKMAEFFANRPPV